MAVNIVFLVLAAVALIRTISYGIYCVRKSVIGGISVFALALGVVFCGVVTWMTGIK